MYGALYDLFITFVARSAFESQNMFLLYLFVCLFDYL